MVVGADTFTGDLLRRLGWENLWESTSYNPEQKRYPHSTVEAIDSAGADVVLLPDEPYASPTRTALVLCAYSDRTDQWPS